MKSGKLEIALLNKLLKRYSLLDSRVIIGPKVGEDAAVIDLGRDIHYHLVLTSDPITFTSEEIGYYGVVVNINDIATMGAIPKWFLATLLFPETATDQRLINKIFRQIHDTCRRFKISFIGGHTEITPKLERVILSGHMIGLVKKNRLVKTGGARAGDILLLAKGICIEGTSIIAREREKELLKRGIPLSLINKAKSFIFNPGIDVLRASQIACKAVSVHSMHDPTEGGLVNGIIEMAIASKKEFEVDLNNIFIYKESKILCHEFGLDPLRVISSGALLLTISPKDLNLIQRVFRKAFIPLSVIGYVRKGPSRVLVRDGKRFQELKPISGDEILKIYPTLKTSTIFYLN